MRIIPKELNNMTKGNRIPDMDTYTTWMLISTAGAILTIVGGILGSWTLLAASCACLLIVAAKAAKFYIPLQTVDRKV